MDTPERRERRRRNERSYHAAGTPEGAGADNATAKAAKPAKANGNGANLGFEAQMFLAADKLRKNLEPSDYKHVAWG